MKRIFLSIVIILSTSTFAKSLEVLGGYSFGKDGVSINVRTGGCTSKKSFRVEVEGKKKKKLSFIRVKEDFCEGFHPYGIKLKFSYKEMGVKAGDTLQLENKLNTWTNVH